MGLQISEIVPKQELKISDLNGKIICVDAFNTLYQFLSTIRQPDGTPLMDSKKRITSHLSGLFYRNISLILQGLKLVYVFDGVPPELKGSTHSIREENRDLAKEKYEQAKKVNNIEAMKRYSSQLTRLNDEMIEESKELLQAMGIAVIQAPGEGEAQAAYLAKTKAYASASQDYDSLLFGAPRLIQNLTLSRKRKTTSGWIEINPEIIELEKVLNHLQISHEQLISLGILIGTDYNPGGIRGIGPKKALHIVKQYKQPTLIFEAMKEQIQNSGNLTFDWQEIFQLFKKPDVKDFEIKFSKFNEKKIKEILVERHEFSGERLENQFEKVSEFLEQKKQSGLSKFF